MGRPVHTARIGISTDTPIPTARVEGFPDPIRFGLHGGIKKFFGEMYAHVEERPGTHDHVIASVAS
jgi:hypothetical protein